MSLYKVRAIEGKRFNEHTRKMEYKVIWKGFSRAQATWEPENNLKYVPELIQQFQKATKQGKIVSHQSSQKSSSSKQELSGSDLVGPSQFDDLPASESPFVQSNKYKDKSEKKKKGRPQKTKKIARKEPQKTISKKQHKQIAKSTNQIQNQFQEKEKISQPQIKGQIKCLVDKNLKARQQVEFNTGLQIMKLAKKDNQFLFLIKEYGQMEWVTRDYLLAEHKQKLIVFYQKKLKFVKKYKQKKEKL